MTQQWNFAKKKHATLYYLIIKIIKADSLIVYLYIKKYTSFKIKIYTKACQGSYSTKAVFFKFHY